MSCMAKRQILKPFSEDLSSLSATSIINLPQGNEDRCGAYENSNVANPDRNVYENLYAVHSVLLSIIFDKFDSEGNLPSGQYSGIGKEILLNTRQWMLNLFNDNPEGIVPDRPIHPISFFSVIKDFESSTNYKWGPVDSKNKRSGTWDDFNFIEGYCDSGTKCRGLYQVSVGAYDQWKNNYEQMCGEKGLGIKGMTGAPDFCAALFWWTILDNGVKCRNMREDPVLENIKPSSSGNNVCVPHGHAHKYKNFCNEPHTWTSDTFAYAYFCAYGQSNQWSQYRIYDTWRKLYTGFKFDNRFFYHNDKEIYGYEQCAIKNFLRRVKVNNNCLGDNASYQESVRPPNKGLIASTVAFFACEINLLPSWLPREYCDLLEDKLTKGSKGEKGITSRTVVECKEGNTIPYIQDFVASRNQ